MIHINRHTQRRTWCEVQHKQKKTVVVFQSGSLNNYFVEIFMAMAQIGALASEEWHID